MANEQEKNITPEQTAEAAALQAGDFSDEYFNEIAQSLVYAEPPMEEETRAELWKNARSHEGFRAGGKRKRRGYGCLG